MQILRSFLKIVTVWKQISLLCLLSALPVFAADTPPTITQQAMATPAIVTGKTSTLTVAATDDAGPSTIIFSWTLLGTPPSTVTFSKNGTNAAKTTVVTFKKSGVYSFLVTITDTANQSVTSSVDVTVNSTLTTITVTPNNKLVNLGATQQYSATAKDQFATLLSPQPAFNWSVNGGGTIDANGLFSASAPGGPFSVTAASGTVSDSATFNVNPPPTLVTPAAIDASPVLGSSAHVSVLADDNSGEAALKYTWASTGPAAVTFTPNNSNAAKNSLVGFKKQGNYALTVTIKDASGLTVTSSVSVVVNQTYTSINVTPAGAYVKPSTNKQFSASAVDQFNLAMTTQPTFSWTVSGGGTIDASTGLFHAGTVLGGPFVVTASSGAISGTANVTVDAAPNIEITAPVSNTTYAAPASFTIQTDALDVDGTIAKVDFFQNNVLIGTSTASPFNFTVANLAPGSYSYKAKAYDNVNFTNMSSTILINVTIVDPNPAVATPASASPNPTGGTSTSLSVLGADNGGESNLTYAWAATGPAAVTFSANGTNAAKNCTATFSIAGSYAITATITDVTNLSVTSSVNVLVNQTLTTINVSPANGVTSLNGTLQYSAIAKDQFNTDMSPQPLISWSVGAGGTIGNTGLFTAGGAAAGPFWVTATSGSISGQATITIANDAPTIVNAATANPSTVLGTTTNLSVLGGDDGFEPSLIYSWSLTGTPPAAVTFSSNNSNAAKNSTATFSKVGTYSLRATITDASGLSITSNVNVVVAPTLTSVGVTPGTAGVNLNGQQQFSALAVDQFGQPVASQPSFIWSVEGGGTIDALGLFTASEEPSGPFVVTASGGGHAGTASVTISDAAPFIITAASANPSPVDGTSTALSVLGGDDARESLLKYAWNVQSGPANAVSFSANSSNAAKNTMATFSHAGEFILRVTISDESDLSITSTVTVTVNSNTSFVAVSPANATISPTTTQQFVANVINQFGDATGPVSWSTSGGGSIDETGLFTAGNTDGGPYAITAESEGLSGTATITISTPQSPGTPTISDFQIIGGLSGQQYVNGIYYTNIFNMPLIVSANAAIDFGTVQVRFTATDEMGHVFTTMGQQQEDGSFTGMFTLANEGQSLDGRYTLAATAIGGEEVTSSISYILVNDSTPPQLVPPPDMIVEGNTTEGAYVTFSADVSDVGTPDIVAQFYPPSGSLFSGDDTVVNVVLIDNSGNFNESFFHVSVRDTIPPQITYISPNIVAEATGPEGATIDFPPAIAQDIFYLNPAITYNILPGMIPIDTPGTFPVGTSVVQVTATDGFGNATTGSFSVTVRDTTPPEFDMGISTFGVTLNGQNLMGGQTGAFVETPSFIHVFDAVTTDPIITFSQHLDTFFPSGTTTVTIYATDLAGNVATGTYIITIIPPPSITLSPSEGSYTNSQIIRANFDRVLPSSVIILLDNMDVSFTTDLSRLPQINEAGFTYDASPLSEGHHTIDVFAYDDNLFTVTAHSSFIADYTPPVVTVGNISALAIDATTPVYAGYQLPKAIDNFTSFNMLTINYNPPPGTLFPPGVTPVHVTVEDLAHNITNATFNVIVASAPVVTTFQINGGLTGQQLLNGVHLTNGNSGPLVLTVGAGVDVGSVGEVDFTATSDTGEVVTVTVNTGNSSQGLYSGTMTLPNDGLYTLSATAAGGQPLTSDTTLQLLVDRTPPKITYTLPVRHSMTDDSDIVFLNGNSDPATNSWMRDIKGVNCYNAAEFLVNATIDDLSGVKPGSQNIARITGPETQTLAITLTTDEQNIQHITVAAPPGNMKESIVFGEDLTIYTYDADDNSVETPYTDPFLVKALNGRYEFHIHLEDMCGNVLDTQIASEDIKNQNAFKIWVDRTAPPVALGTLFFKAARSAESTGDPTPDVPCIVSTFDAVEAWQGSIDSKNWLFKAYRTPTLLPTGKPDEYRSANRSTYVPYTAVNADYHDNVQDGNYLMEAEIAPFLLKKSGAIEVIVRDQAGNISQGGGGSGTPVSLNGIAKPVTLDGPIHFSPAVINVPTSFNAHPDDRKYIISHDNIYTSGTSIPTVGVNKPTWVFSAFNGEMPYGFTDLVWDPRPQLDLDDELFDIYDPDFDYSTFPDSYDVARLHGKIPAVATNDYPVALKDIQPGLGRVAVKFDVHDGYQWANVVSLTPDFATTGNIATLRISGGFLDPTNISQFLLGDTPTLPAGEKYLIRFATGDGDITGDPDEPDPEIRKNKITLMKNSDGSYQQALIFDQTSPSVVQVLEVTVEIGSNVNPVLCNVDVKLGRVKAYFDDSGLPQQMHFNEEQHGGPDNSYHRLAKALNLIKFPVDSLYQLQVASGEWGVDASLNTSNWKIELDDSAQDAIVWLNPDSSDLSPASGASTTGKTTFPFNKKFKIVGKASTESNISLGLLMGSQRLDVPLPVYRLIMSQTVDQPSYGKFEGPNQPYGLLGHTGQFVALPDTNDLGGRNIKFSMFTWESVPEDINGVNSIAVNCIGTPISGTDAAVRIEGWRPGFNKIRCKLPTGLEIGNWEAVCHIPTLHAPNLGQIAEAAKYIQTNGSGSTLEDQAIDDVGTYPWKAETSEGQVPNRQGALVPIATNIRKLQAQRMLSEYVLTQFADVEKSSPLDDDFLFIFGDGNITISRAQADSLLSSGGGMTIGPKLNLIKRFRKYDGATNAEITNNTSDDYLALKVVAREQLDYSVLCVLKQGVSVKFDPSDYVTFASAGTTDFGTVDFAPGHNMLHASWSNPHWWTWQTTVAANVAQLFTDSGVPDWKLAHPYTREVIKYMVAQREDLAKELKAHFGTTTSNLNATFFKSYPGPNSGKIYVFDDLSWESEWIGPSDNRWQWKGTSIFDTHHGTATNIFLSENGNPQTLQVGFEENASADWITSIWVDNPDSNSIEGRSAISFANSVQEGWYLTRILLDLETNLQPLQELRSVAGNIGIEAIWAGNTIFSLDKMYQGSVGRDLITDQDLKLTISERIIDIGLASVDFWTTAVPLAKGVGRLATGGARLLKGLGGAAANSYKSWAAQAGLAQLSTSMEKIAEKTTIDLAGDALIAATADVLTKESTEKAATLELAKDGVEGVLKSEVAARTSTRVETVIAGEAVSLQDSHLVSDVADSISRSNPTRSLAAWSREIKAALKTADGEYWTTQKLREFVRGACFVAGTRVKMADGSTKRIEDIKPGDFVLSRHETGNGGLCASEVRRTYERISDHVRTLRFKIIRPQSRFRTRSTSASSHSSALSESDGDVDTECYEIVQTTDEHPFWQHGIGWTRAADIHLGDLVDLAFGSFAVCVSTYKISPCNTAVYNLEVQGTHTYFVSGANIWVHNSCERLEQFRNFLKTAGAKNPYRPGIIVKGKDVEKLYYEVFIKEGFQGPVEETFRLNVSRNLDKRVADWTFHAHHVFPKEFVDEFAKIGINVHDPRFGAWWKAGPHIKNVVPYQNAWKQFFKGSVSYDKAMLRAQELAEKYGFSWLPPTSF